MDIRRVRFYKAGVVTDAFDHDEVVTDDSVNVALTSLGLNRNRYDVVSQDQEPDFVKRLSCVVDAFHHMMTHHF